MDYNKIAKEILMYLGGENNVASAAHCATRLRLVLNDDKKANIKKIEKMEAVKGVFNSGGQLQIIIGQGTVNKVYNAFIEGTKIGESSLSDNKKAAMKNMNPFERFARMLSSIFLPIIPAIVASGLLMGILGMLQNFHLVDSKSGMYILLNMFSNAAFVFLPVLIAFSAAKQFGTNPFLAATLAGIMIHPDLQNAWTLGTGIKNSMDFYGLHVSMVGYQGQVLPILIAVWVMGYIERGLRKIVPDILDILLTPFLTVLITGFFTFFIIGPAGRFLGDGLSFGLVTIYNTAGVFAGILFGGFYSFIVITGIHQSFQAVEAGLLANPSIHRDFLLPIWSMANVAQGGAAFAVYFITKNAKMKSIAGPASLSAVLGITEPAIFGVNLRYRRPFIAAAIGGAIGGGYVVFTKVVMTGMGVSGIPGTTIVPPSSILNYVIGMVIAFATAFVVTSVLGIKEKEEEEEEEEEKEEEEKEEKGNNDKDNKVILLYNEVKANTVSNLVSPVNGNVILLKDVPDKTFSDELLGKGIGVDPEDGIVVSPVDGTVVCLFETKHAIAIKTSDGMEILIHIGIDTVKMNGEGFKSFINSGDVIKKGQKLMEFDLDLVKEKAKSPIVLLVITNSDSMKFVNQLKSGKIKQGEELMRVGIN